MNWIAKLFSDIGHFLTSDKAKKIELQIAALLPFAMQIVNEINTIAPNKTLTQLNTIATKYALPAISQLQDGQTAGNVALNLGTEILQKNHAPNAATSLLNTVIQLAVLGSK